MAIELDEKKIAKAIEIAKAFGVKTLILFGSALESPQTARDLDLACEGIHDWSFFKFGARLEEELHLPLDLVPLEPPSRFTELIKSRGKVLYES